MGLNQDNGIIYIPNNNGPNSSHIQKKIVRAFMLLGFKIDVSSNDKIVHFLDVTLNVSDNTYKPFLKTDQYPAFININSNHPKTIIKQVPKAVKLRINNLSANEKIFQESSKIYKDAPKNSGFVGEFTHQEENISDDINKENKKCCQKIEKEKLYGLTPPPPL